MDTKEYAPEYTSKEKLVRVMSVGVLGVGVFGLYKFIAKPYLEGIASDPECYEIMGISGVEFVWNLIFFGYPFLMFVLTVVLMLPLGIRGFIEGQFPPRGVKVYKPTVIRRGALGVFFSAVHIVLPASAFGLTVWGHFQIDIMMALHSSQQSAVCTQSYKL